MTTEEILKKEGIIKHKGKLIYPDENGYFWFGGRRYSSLLDAQIRAETYIKPGKKPRQ